MGGMPRPRDVRRSAGRGPSNFQLAATFREIADMLDILDAVPYKAVAYRRVADAIERHPADVAALIRDGHAPKLTGVGPAIGSRLRELATTGRSDYHEGLRAQVPAGLLDILRIPGVGPRTVRALHVGLGIDSLDGLRAAAQDGRLRELPGMSRRTEENVLAGIARLERKLDRLLLHDADRLVEALIATLQSTPGVARIEVVGSLRRRQATIGDLDLVAATDRPGPLVNALSSLTEVSQVLASGQDKATILLEAGTQVDLMLCPPEAWGSHLVHFTGSRDHNIALRGRALDRGLSLSEKGFKVLDSGELLPAASEEEVYARLDLDWVPPELRENRGEIAAAAEGRLPSLVQRGDIRGDTHTHSDWTDGVDDIEVMARAARATGLEYMVLTDHSPSLGVTRGLSPARVAEQQAAIEALNADLAPFRILHGTELEILGDGSLDYPDEMLSAFDVVVASIHSGRNQPMEQLTRRALAAIANPHVDVLAHPSGRIVNAREPAMLDWARVFEAAALTGTLLEINGSPRLDLDDDLALAAGRAGAHLTLASDAHRTEEFAYLDYATSVARRAWLEPEQVANTRDAAGLLELVQ